MRTAKLMLAVLASIGFAGAAQASIIQIGDDAIAFTDGDIAVGDGSRARDGIAMGVGSAALGGGGCEAIAVGTNAQAGCTGGISRDAIAFGRNANAQSGSLAFGFGASANNNSISIGNASLAYQDSVAIGTGAQAAILGSVAIGSGSLVGGSGGYVAIKGQATGLASIAIGGQALHTNSVALGDRSRTDRDNQLSVGRPGEERQISNVRAATAANDAVIYQQVVPAIQGIVTGLGGGATYNPATGVMTAPSYVLSMGTYNDVGSALTALDNKPGNGGGGTDPLFAATGDRVNNPAIASGPSSVAAGERAVAAGEDTTAIGAGASATIDGASAFGARARAEAYCTSVGYAAVCTDNFTTSFGRAGDETRLVHVAPGIANTDAMNMGQGRAAAVAFGGGAGFNAGGTFVPPSYNFISGAVYNDVGAALADLDGRLNALEENPPGSGPQGPRGDSAYQVAVNNGFAGSESEWLASLKGDQGERGETGPQGPAGEGGTGTGPEGPQGPAGHDGRSAYEVAVVNGFEGSESEWLESLQGADGRDGRDGTGATAVAGRNIEVMDNGDGTQTVSLADNVELSDQGSVRVGATTVNADGVSIQGGPSMTVNGIDAGNQRITSVADGRIEHGSTDAVNGGQIHALQSQWNDNWNETNRRIDQTNDRIDALGAQSAAMAMMSGSSSNLNVGEVALTSGVGFYGNKAAFAVGLKGRASKRSTWSMGISVSPEGKAMGGVGYSYTFGR